MSRKYKINDIVILTYNTWGNCTKEFTVCPLEIGSKGKIVWIYKDIPIIRAEFLVSGRIISTAMSIYKVI